MEQNRRKLFMRRPDLETLPPMPSLPPGYQLRSARSEDAGAIAETMVSAFGDDWSAERVNRALLEAEDVTDTFVVTADGMPVATASTRLMPEVYPGSGYVHWVATHADHRGKQLGKVVCLAVLQSFVDLGCRDAVLETDLPRLPAIRLYLNLGFVPEYVFPEHEELWRQVVENLAGAGARAPASRHEQRSDAITPHGDASDPGEELTPRRGAW